MNPARNRNSGTADIRTLTPTICRLMGSEPPARSLKRLQDDLIETINRDGIDRIDRCLVYAPDAIGSVLSSKFPFYFDEINRISQYKVALRSVFPPKTPVCFASMFTGTLPEIHGIKRYEKPVVETDTLFDTLTRAGIKVAIVAVKDSSIDIIFRNRKIDYYTETYDQEVITRTAQLIQDNRHQFILAYNQEYDDLLHRTEPFSSECLEAVQRHNDNYLNLIAQAANYWSDYNFLTVYAPDHGAHIDEKGRGDHGADIPEDMEILHYYTFRAGLT